MLRFLLTAGVVCLAFCGLLESRALAQYPGQSGLNQPSFGRPGTGSNTSRYLNLLRGGNPAINYYGLIRPQTDLSNSLLRLQTQQQALTQAENQMINGLLPATGHSVRFFNYGSYFNQGTARPLPGSTLIRR
jgi:hypothetical protein